MELSRKKFASIILLVAIFVSGNAYAAFHVEYQIPNVAVNIAGYYKIYKQKFVAGKQTFVNILKKLEKEGIVNRKVIEVRPPRVEYSLTDKGKEVAKILYELDKLL